MKSVDPLFLSTRPEVQYVIESFAILIPDPSRRALVGWISHFWIINKIFFNFWETHNPLDFAFTIF
jgi:hypothetical protein